MSLLRLAATVLVAVLPVLSGACFVREPSASIRDASVVEGSADEPTELVFRVTISTGPAIAHDATIHWKVLDGTATGEGDDFVTASGAVTFRSGGDRVARISVPVVADEFPEPDETLQIKLTRAENARLLTRRATGTILNDDGLVLRVDPSGDGTGGLTWPTAFVSLQEAVDAAEAAGGGAVWVAASTYVNGGGSGPVLDLREHVHVYGGFEGYAGGAGARERLLSDRVLATTTLDGRGAAQHVVTGANDATLDGFTVTGGYAGGTEWPQNEGGGMLSRDVTGLTVANCTFRGNTAAARGGGMMIRTSSSSIERCTFEGNTSADGGGIASLGSTPRVSRTRFLGNTADRGGGMYNLGSTPVVRNCAFSGNVAAIGVGGMHNSDSVAHVIGCTLSGNRGGPDGGGLGSFSAPLDLCNCVLWGNSAPQVTGSGTVRHCDVEGGFAGEGNLDADPLFLDADGADGICGTGDDDLRLSAGSPCIDAGDSAVVEENAVDLEGNPRRTDDPDTPDTGQGGAPVVDMGACEHQPQ